MGRVEDTLSHTPRFIRVASPVIRIRLVCAIVKGPRITDSLALPSFLCLRCMLMRIHVAFGSDM